MFWLGSKARRHADSLFRLLTLFRVVARGITITEFTHYCRLQGVEAGNFDLPDSFPKCSLFPQVSLTYFPDSNDKSFVGTLQIMGFDELRGMSVLINRESNQCTVILSEGGRGATILAVRTVSRLLKLAKSVETDSKFLKGYFFCDFGL